MLAILVSLVLCVPAQEKKERQIELWGHVKTALIRQGILGAKVTLMREDSTVIDTMRVFQEWHGDGKIDAAYKFKVPARRVTYIIKAEHPDYETAYVTWKMPPIGRNTFFDAPWHLLKPRQQRDYAMEGQLDEVVVSKTRIKVFSRGDTLVYNADAFKLLEGSMLDDLIRQLPGAELKDDGQIIINGRRIDELTLNGKDFFGGSTKIMLENLPAYVVNQLKVYEKSTERSQWLGREVEDKRYAMDVVLKRQYNVGMLGNATLAGGSPLTHSGEDERKPWIARLFGLRYTDNSRLSFYASGNNVNAATQPNVEIDGDWHEGGGGNGRNDTRNAGLDLMVDDREKRFQENLSITTSWRKSHLDVQTSSEQYLANAGSSFSRSTNSSTDRNWQLEVQNNFKTANPLSVWHTHANLGVQYQHQKGGGEGLSAQLSGDPQSWGNPRQVLDSVFAAQLDPDLQRILVNRQRTQRCSDGSSLKAWGNMGIWHKTAWGDDGGINFRPGMSRQQSDSYSMQRINYMAAGEEGRGSAFYRYSPVEPVTNYDFAIAPYYSFNLLHGFSLYTDYTYYQQYHAQHNDTYLLDRLAGFDAMGRSLGDLPSTRDSLQLALDANNSNRQTSLNRNHALAAALRYRKNTDSYELNSRLYLTLRHDDNRLHYASLLLDTTLTQHTTDLEPDLVLSYNRKARGDSTFRSTWRLNYNLRLTQPSLLNRVAVNNDTDPLNIRLGNPDLEPTLTHSLSVSCYRFRNRPFASHLMSGRLSVYRNRISMGHTYDPATGVHTYRPENMNGNWSASLGNQVHFSLDKQANWAVDASTACSYGRNVDYSSAMGSSVALSHVNNWNASQELRLVYQSDGHQLSVNASADYRHATQHEGTISDVNAWNFKYGVFGMLSLWKKATLSSSVNMYSKRGYGDPSLNRDELIWNASATYWIVGRKLSLQLEAYDLLHQLSNITVSINGQGRTETVYNTLPRYVMLKLTYRFQSFPKRDTAQRVPTIY